MQTGRKEAARPSLAREPLSLVCRCVGPVTMILLSPRAARGSRLGFAAGSRRGTSYRFTGSETGFPFSTTNTLKVFAGALALLFAS